MARLEASLIRWLPVVFVALAGLVAGGVGYWNGDAAVYAHQAAECDLHQRWTHLGWVAVGAVLSPMVGTGLPAALDAVVTVAAASAVALVGRAQGVMAGVCAAAVVLPVCAIAEVDVPWAAALLGAAMAPRVMAVVLAGVACSLSPVALLGMPWVALHRRDGWVAAGGLLAVLSLTLLSGGDWWTGDRGVWSSAHMNPVRTLEVWGRWPWWLVLAGVRFRRDHLALAPLLLAPADVHAWVFAGWALCLDLDTRAPRAWGALVLAVGLVGLGDTRHRVRQSAARVEAAAQLLGPADGLVAPWTLGVRVSLAATGTPYALLWRPPSGFVRDQAERWCDARPARVLFLSAERLSWLPETPRAGCPR